MKELFLYRQLTEEAKKRAVVQVTKRELDYEQDWTRECQTITEQATFLIEEEGLVCKALYWETNYGVNVDYSHVDIHDDYIQKWLSKDQYEIYQEIQGLSGGSVEESLDMGREFVSLSYDTYYEYDQQEAMEFIQTYAKDKQLKTKYRLPLLMDAELEGEALQQLEKEVDLVAQSILNEYTKIISKHIKELKDDVEKMIGAECDYLGSEEYYQDKLEEGYLSDDEGYGIYKFNIEGIAIMRGDNFLSYEFEEEYSEVA